MVNTKRMKNVTVNFHFILALVLILWINSGIFSYVSIYIPDSLKMLVFFIWFIIACLKNEKFLVNYLWNSKLLLVFFLLLLIANNYISTIYITYYIKTTMFLFVIYSILIFYYKPKYINEMKTMVYILVLDYVYVGINTVIKLLQFPNLARILSKDEGSIGEILGDGVNNFLAIGNYTFAYSMIFVGLFFGYKVYFEKKIRFIFGYIAVLILLIFMEFTMSILLMVLFTVIIIFMIFSRNRIRMIINTMFLLPIFILLLMNLPELLVYISSYLPVAFESKIISIAEFLQGGNIDGVVLSIRINLYMQSINSFMDNIFIGALGGSGEIGQHASWLDFLGQFGLLSFPIFLFLLRGYKYITKSLPRELKTYVKISFLYFIVLGFVNTAYTPRLLLTLFVFVPFVTKSCLKKPLLTDLRGNYNDENSKRRGNLYV